jgi:arabinose-5-phosphate isomerase
LNINMSVNDIITCGRAILGQEAGALQRLAETMDVSFAQAVQLILDCRGRVVVSGVGKSGRVGEKIAASLASLGTPAFFMHADEAVHGDLGMLNPQDVVILISHSGETGEALQLLPHLSRIGCALIAITGNPQSTLALAAKVHLDTGVRVEADSRKLAPTTSATVTMAIGDALALTLADARGFSREDFLRLHPGGSLGKQSGK